MRPPAIPWHILRSLYDLSNTGKGFPNDVNFCLVKVRGISTVDRLVRFTLQQNIHVAEILLEVDIYLKFTLSYIQYL